MFVKEKREKESLPIVACGREEHPIARGIKEGSCAKAFVFMPNDLVSAGEPRTWLSTGPRFLQTVLNDPSLPLPSIFHPSFFTESKTYGRPAAATTKST